MERFKYKLSTRLSIAINAKYNSFNESILSTEVKNYYNYLNLDGMSLKNQNLREQFLNYLREYNNSAEIRSELFSLVRDDLGTRKILEGSVN